MSSDANLRFPLILSICGALGTFVLNAQEPGDFAWRGETMGTTYSIKLARAALTDEPLDRLKREVDQRLQEINRQMSHYQPDSELSQFNRHQMTTPFKVSSNFAAVVRFALELNQQSNGAFDPTLGPLINVWGFGQQGDRFEPPSERQIQEARRICGCRHLRVTELGELQKSLPQLQLNLSAVAKGYGVDEVARLIRQQGITNLFVEIGGEVVVGGLNFKQQPWRIGVEAPVPDAGPGGAFEAIIPLTDAAIATSGDYRRFYEDAQGRKYAHILDPRTGWPVQHNLVSISVVADNCLAADGIATTLFVMGVTEGLAWIEKHPTASALFMIREADGTVRKLASRRFPKWIDPTVRPPGQ